MSKPRRAWIPLAAALLVVLLAFTTGCLTSRGGKTLKEIKTRKYMTFATDGAYPPMEFADEQNELIGFDIDLGTAICEKIGVEHRPMVVEWEGIIPGLVDGKYDVIMSAMNITEERSKSVDFVQYCEMGQLVVVAAGNPRGITGLNDLAGKVVAVQTGTTNEEAARGVSGTEVRVFGTFTDAMLEVASGRADASILDSPVAKHYILAQPGKYETAGDVFMEAPVGIAVRKTDPDLKKAIEDALEELKKDGTFDRIYEKWFGE